MADTQTASPPADPAEQQQQETQPTPHDLLMDRIRGEAVVVDPQGDNAPAAKPPEKPAQKTEKKPADSIPDDPLISFLGDQEPTTDEPSTDDTEDQDEDDGIDPTTLKSQEDWTRAKEKLRTKIDQEYQNRLTALEDKIKEREREIEELTGTVSKYDLAKSPAYKKQFIEPKRQAIADIERIAGDDEQVKTLINKMRAGTLSINDVPDLEGLPRFKYERIYRLADDWLKVHESEQVALENHKETQKQLELQEMEIEKQRGQQYQQHISNQLHHATSKALAEAAQRLPGFDQTHSQKVIAQLGSQDPLGSISKALAVAAWAPSHIANVVSARDQALSELKEAKSKLAALEKRVGGADQLNRLTTSGTTPRNDGQGDTRPGESPHDALMRRIRENAMEGM